MKELVLVGKALADASRVRALYALVGEDLCVCELCDALDLTQSTLSTHLQVMREAGLVITRKEGKWIYYGIDPEKKSVITSLFRFFEGGLVNDRVMRADRKRLQRRLAERENGLCCRGFTGAKTKCC